MLHCTATIHLLTLKGPRKKSICKCRLLKSSAANNCQTLMANLSIQAKIVDPEQTAPIIFTSEGFVVSTFRQT